jgi:hypothetical protein
VAGGLNVAIGAVQVFAPGVADGDWIARSGFAGRAVGNLRQPNHLSSLLMWSVLAVGALLQTGRVRRRSAALAFAAPVAGVAMTASQTGLVSVLVLAARALLDRSLALMAPLCRTGRALPRRAALTTLLVARLVPGGSERPVS